MNSMQMRGNRWLTNRINVIISGNAGGIEIPIDVINKRIGGRFKYAKTIIIYAGWRK